MPGSYMPDKQSEQVQWIANFANVITATPTIYGLTAAQASAFMQLKENVDQYWAAAENPASRTAITISQKNDALKAAKDGARPLVGIIQSTPTVTDAQKIAAGVTVRKTHPTPIPAPDQSPFIKIKSTRNRTATIQLQQDAERRGKPAKVAGATIFIYEGTTPPMDASAWKFYANVSKPAVTIDFGASATSGTVWITAFWKNAKDESGPAADPVSIALPAYGMLPSEADQAPVKLAA